MIIYKVGNLLDAEEHIIAHGVNASGGYASGVARQIAIKYPKAKQEYLHKFRTEGWVLGDIQAVICDGRIVVNCCTQQNYGRELTIYCDYNAIQQCVEKLLLACKKNGLSLAIPKIGAGLANGCWIHISEDIERLSEKYGIDVNVYILSENDHKE